MLLKGKDVIALFSAKRRRFTRITQVRRSGASAKSQGVACEGRGGAWLVSLVAYGEVISEWTYLS